MNKKKNYSFLLLLSVSSIGYSAQPYFGANVGSMFFSNKETITAAGVTGSINRLTAIDGFIASGLAGARFASDQTPYFLDTEIFLGYNLDGTTKINTLTGPPFVSELDESLTSQWGVHVLPGYTVLPYFNIYGVFGYIQTRYQSFSLDGVTEGYTGSQNIAFNGGEVGIGGEIKLHNNLSLRLQDAYIFYHAKTKTTLSPGLDNLPVTMRSKPYANLVTLGIIQKWQA